MLDRFRVSTNGHGNEARTKEKTYFFFPSPSPSFLFCRSDPPLSVGQLIQDGGRSQKVVSDRAQKSGINTPALQAKFLPGKFSEMKSVTGEIATYFPR